MIRNSLRQRWAEGKPAINGWLSIGNPFTAEIMAAQGYDMVTVDIQHGALAYSDALPMFQAMRASGVALGARVPWLDPAAIMKALDAGAMNIICPMISSAEDADAFVRHLRYPPDGERSFGPTRAGFAFGGYDAKIANEEIVALAMIETRAAMDNLEEIAKTPGLDALYVGPADLSLALGQGEYAPGFDREEPEMIDAIKHILGVAKANGKRAALHCGSPDYAGKAIEWGFDMCTVSADARLLAAGAAAHVARFRELTGGA